MPPTTTNESQTQQEAIQQRRTTSQELAQRSSNDDSANHGDQHPQTAPSATSKVFGITELLEMVLLNADQSSLHTSLPRVSKAFHETILGSLKLQRNLHAVPDWTHRKLCPAPLPSSILTYTTRKTGLFDPSTAPTISPNARHSLNVRFSSDAISWACNPDRSANAAFRAMLICQPPVVAVEIFCWSSVNYSPFLEKNRIENEEGVTCGELFDLVREASPIGGHAKLMWFFDGREV